MPSVLPRSVGTPAFGSIFSIHPSFGEDEVELHAGEVEVFAELCGGEVAGGGIGFGGGVVGGARWGPLERRRRCGRGAGVVSCQPLACLAAVEFAGAVGIPVFDGQNWWPGLAARGKSHFPLEMSYIASRLNRATT